VFQIVDLRKAQAERMGGDSVVEFSARFADRREPGGARVEMGCQIYFFLEEPDAIVSIWPSQVQDVESFVGIHKEIPRCADAFRWKRISARALLPPEAQYAVIQLSAMRSDGLPLEEKELGQQYADSPTFTVTSYGPRTGPVPVGNGRKR
jgi:hypothetical protein